MDSQEPQRKLEVTVETTEWMGPSAGSFALELKELVQTKLDQGHTLLTVVRGSDFDSLIFAKPLNDSPDEDHYDVVPNTTVAKGTPVAPDTPRPARQAPPLSAL